MEDSEKSNDIFISYRRADVEFTKQIYEGLQRAELTVWVDWDDIPPGVEGFSDEIQRGIEGAVAFICILSPSYLESEYCLMELKEAIRLKKRIVPVVLKKFEPTPPPEGIGHINWVYFTPHAGQENAFEQSFPKVIQAITADYEHLREHTKLLQRAIEWQKNGKSKGYLLTVAELEKAERWQAASAGKDPLPTELHGEYILDSRKDATRKQRNTLVGVTIALVVSIALGVAALVQRQIAITQATISRSGELAAQSTEIRKRDFQVSLLLGIEGYRAYNSVQTRRALLDATNSNPLIHFLPLPQGSGSVGALSSDGKIYASANADQTIDLWDVANRKLIGQPLKGHKGAVSYLTFSRDGKILASGGCTGPQTDLSCSAGEVFLWNVDTQQLIGHPITGFTGLIRGLDFSPDSKMLVTLSASSQSNPSSIIFWDTTTLQPTENQPKPPEGAYLNEENIALSKDGKTLAAISDPPDNMLTLWNVETGNILDQFQVGYITGGDRLLFSPDGNTVIIGGWFEGTTVWDLKSHASKTPDGLSDSYQTTSIAISPDGKTLALAKNVPSGNFGQDEGEIDFWDLDTLRPTGIQLIGGHTDRINTMAFSPDGKNLTSSGKSQVILWKVPVGLAPNEPLGQVIFGGPSDTSQVYAMKLAFSPDGKTFAASTGANQISQWDVGTRKLKEPDLKGGAFAFSQDGKTLASVDDKGIILWDVAKQQSVTLPIDTSDMAGIALSSDSKTLISYKNSSHEITLWDISNPGLGTPASESFAVGSSDKTIYSTALSLKGKILAVGIGSNIILWDLQTHKQIGEPLIGHKDPVMSLSFSADGNTLASSDDNNIILWNTATHQPIGQPYAGVAPALSADGKTLATLINTGGDFSVNILLWDVPTHETIGQPLIDSTGIRDLALSPDGKTVASIRADGGIVLWDLDPNSWIRQNCQRVGRNLTRAEWTQYFPNEKYRQTCDQWTLETETVAKPAVNPTNANPTEDLSLATQPPSNAQPPATEAPVTQLAALPVEGAMSTETPPVEGAPPTEPPAATASSAPEAANTYTEEFDGNLDAWTSFMTTGVDKQVNTTLSNGSLEVKLSPYEDKEPRVYWVNNSYTYTDVQVEVVTTNNGNNANGVTLICQYSDLGWYGFTMSNAGLYSIYGFDPNRFADERYVTLANGGSAAIKGGQSTNTYAAVCKGNELSLYVNGTLVKTVTDKTLYFTQGKIGFGVISPLKLPVDVQLESVSVSIPK